MNPTTELEKEINPDVINDKIREQLVAYSKDFKTSWVSLGRTLYTVWRDKLYYGWGYEKFEYYTEQELGIKKQLSMKLLKTYFFLEQEEPEYLKQDFQESREASVVPNYDAVNVLRMAKNRKELERQDYIQLKKKVFENGADASVVRKDLTALMKERKEVDPEEERDKRNRQAIKKLIGAIDTFERDMEALKLIPEDLLLTARDLLARLKCEIE